jgi:hypothetical protein
MAMTKHRVTFISFRGVLPFTSGCIGSISPLASDASGAVMVGEEWANPSISAAETSRSFFRTPFLTILPSPSFSVGFSNSVFVCLYALPN